MKKEDAIMLIDDHKNNRHMIDPVELLYWTQLRVIVNNISDEHWDLAVAKAAEVMSR